MLAVRFMVNFYYVIVMAWAIFYISAGFQKYLPWESCLEHNQIPTLNTSMPDWHEPNCYVKELGEQCAETYNSTFYNGQCTSFHDYCSAHGFNPPYLDDDHCDANTTVSEVLVKNSIYPSEDYLNGFVLGYTKPNSNGTRHSWDDYGSLRWELCLCLLLSWIIICLSMIQGLQSYGKVAYVVTLSPYFVLTALLAYAAGLEGAKDGIIYFLSPEWDKLAVSHNCLLILILYQRTFSLV